MITDDNQVVYALCSVYTTLRSRLLHTDSSFHIFDRDIAETENFLLTFSKISVHFGSQEGSIGRESGVLMNRKRRNTVFIVELLKVN